MEMEPEERQEEQSGESRSGAQVRKEEAAGRELYMYVHAVAYMLVTLILVFTFVARINIVSGESMENTLWDKDAMLIWTLGYEPKQGDVVVLTKGTYGPDMLVKRVIATEGQTVDIDYDQGTVEVDGVVLEEDYIKERMHVPIYGEGVNHVTVPEGSIFVMGDNRNHSSDSRLPAIGIVDTRCVIGRAVAVIYPFADLKLL